MRPLSTNRAWHFALLPAENPSFYTANVCNFRIILAWQRDFTFFSWAIKHQRFTDDLYITGAWLSRTIASTIKVLVSRSSVAIFTLMSSWCSNACSISASTPSVKPLLPSRTTGLSGCARPFRCCFCLVLRFIVFLLTLGLKTGHSTAISHISPNRRVKFTQLVTMSYPHGKVK